MITPTDEQVEARLDELSKEEFLDVARQLRPDITDEEFDLDWAEFLLLRERKELQ